MQSQMVWQVLVGGQITTHNGTWRDQPGDLNELLNLAKANNERFVIWPTHKPGGPAPRETWTFELLNLTQRANAPRGTVEVYMSCMRDRSVILL